MKIFTKWHEGRGGWLRGLPPAAIHRTARKLGTCGEYNIREYLSGKDLMAMAGDNNMLYLLFGTLVGIVLGINIAVLYHRFIGSKGKKEQKLRDEIRDLERRLKQKDDYIARAIKSIKEEEATRKELIK
ncbi:MAG: hypothetical protein ACOX48_08155 [Limnochordia bacterium]